MINLGTNHLPIARQRRRDSVWDCLWRGCLSLRDPTALTGRAGHPNPDRAILGLLCVSPYAFLIVFAVCVGTTRAGADEGPAPVRQRRLVMAFASHRERPAFAGVFFYRHDAAGKGAARSQALLGNAASEAPLRGSAKRPCEY